ncbi:MAG: cobalt ECF transporter T component CbiQ [Thermoplasmata archaeon]|jgi:cobalt/nickel transport system permease protein
MAEYLEKTLEDLSDYFRSVYFSGDFSSRNGLVQRANPDVALIILISFIVLAVIISDIYFIAFLYLISILFIILSGIDMKFYLRSIVFIPLFTAIIALPYIFYPFSQPPFLYSMDLLGFRTGITYSGLNFSLLLFLRVITAVSFMIVITYGIGFRRLLGAMKSLGFPDVLINMLSFTYRYIFLIVSQVHDMLLSRKSKMCHADRKIANRWQSYLLGHIFYRSHFMGENMYYCMVSRGYDGENPGMKKRNNLTYIDLSLIMIFILVVTTRVIIWW